MLLATDTDFLANLGSAEPDRRLAGRNSTKADILLYRRDGVDLAVKDYSRRPWIVRNTVGRVLLRRETAAYRAAAGVPGLPEFYGRCGRFRLATRWVDAEPLAGRAPRTVDPAIFDRLRRIVSDLHARGVAHADLHRRDVLIGRTGEVWLVDLATACVLGERPGRLRRAVFERCCDADRVALARMRARFTGGDVAAAVDAVGGRAAAWHRRGRRVKRAFDRVRRLLARR